MKGCFLVWNRFNPNVDVIHFTHRIYNIQSYSKASNGSASSFKAFENGFFCFLR